MNRNRASWLLTCIACLVAALATAIPAAAQVVPEVSFLPGDLAPGPAPGLQQDARVAAGAGIFLVVWTDYRTSPDVGPPFATEGSGADVYAVRLDANGSPLDASPIVLTDALGDQDDTRVAWNGTHWLVMWSGPNRSGFDSHLQAVRVAPDGTVPDEPFHVLGAGSSGSISYTLTSNGSDWLVIYQGNSAGSSSFRGTRITAAGTVLDPGGIQFLDPPSLLSFAAASASGEYLVAWSSSSTVQARRFDAGLNPIGPAFSVPGLRFGSDGSEYFIAWTAGGQLVGSPMSPQGTLDFPAGIPVATATSIISQPGVAWDGINWWVCWQHAIDGIEVARVSPGGFTLDFDGIPIDPAFEDFASGPAIAGGAGGVQVAWTDRRAGGLYPDDVYGAHVSVAGVPDTSAPLSLGARGQRRVDLATGDGQVLAVFRGDRSGSRVLLGQRIDAFGAALDPEPFVIADVPLPSAPRVAWNGSLWLVVWSESGFAFGRRVDASGTVIDGTPIAIGELAAPDVEALGEVFLVAGTQPTIGIHFYHPFAVRVDGTTGAVLDPEEIYLGQYFARSPGVAAVGGRWLVAWARHPTHDNPQANVWAAFVEPDGTTPGEFVVEYNAFTPRMAYSGDEVMFVMRANSTANANNDIKARRMLPDGTFPASAFVVAAETDRQTGPAVTWNGAEFVAFWNDKRNVTGYWDERAEVFGARIDQGGSLVDPRGFSFAGPTRPEIDPAVTTIDGQVLAAASIFREEAPLCSFRVGYDVYGDEVPGNRWPVAVATATPPGGATPFDATLDSAGSSDPDGVAVGFDWDFDDDSGASGPLVDHTFQQARDHLVQLQVTDDDGADTLQTILVRTLPPNKPPVAVATASTVSGDPPLSIVFHAAGSYDPEGSITNFEWHFGDGGTYWGGTAYHTYTQPGVYTTTLKVHDDESAIGEATLQIWVGESPGPGECPDGDGVPGTQLTLGKSAAGDALALGWGASCAAATDYAIYEGALGDWSSHASLLCSTAGATFRNLMPPPGGAYYLIVPVDDTTEGSYGRDSSGGERPQGAEACRPQLLSDVCRQ